jgi:Zn-dependent protease with chaperone function
MGVERINSFRQCVSTQEQRQRPGVAFVNLLIWVVLILAVVGTLGILLVFVALGWILRQLLASYNVRKLQALGATVSPQQFPAVAEALAETCQQFRIADPPRVIVVNGAETNAFAVKFARKKVILILSELLEGVIDQPAELRALIGHELCHITLDHGARGAFEIYKPARYRAARELTCDNAAYVAGGDLDAAKSLLKKLCVGKTLYATLSEDALVEEADDIYSGLVGWFLRRNLHYPPAGARIKNVVQFSNEV